MDKSHRKAQTAQADHRLLRDGDSTFGTLPAATGLGLAGFFFSLLQPMLGMVGQPTIRQQGLQGSRVAWGNGGNPTQHVGQVGPNVNAVPPSTLHQRVERRRRLAARKQATAADRPVAGNVPPIPTRRTKGNYGG